MAAISSPSPSVAEDWRWLTGEAAGRLLEELGQSTATPLQRIRRLRKTDLSPERIRMVVEQLTLRPLARKKFSLGGQMFLVRQLFEQATDQRIAAYKAGRFADAGRVVDFCCGLGGDLMALGRVARSTGVDASEVAVELARANCRVAGVDAAVCLAKAETFSREPDDWFHIDPDRRKQGRRSTRVEQFAPGAGFLEQLLRQQRHGAVKLAPATAVPEDWGAVERQWIGSRYECKQQVLWSGEAARSPGRKSAAAIDHDGSTLFEWTESAAAPCQLASEPGPFLYEPHPSIIAGRMVDSLAAGLGLRKLATDVPYLTGSELDGNAVGISRFEILEMTRLERRPIQDGLARHQCGPLEVKKRGVDHRLLEYWSGKTLAGDQRLVLVLTRIGHRQRAIICRRIPAPRQRSPA